MHNKSKYLILFFLISLFLGDTVIAQEEHKTPADSAEKCTNILGAFRNGHFHGHIRNYFMATVNDGLLKDYYANATGGALKFETAQLYGFSLGIEGIFSYNTFSSDLNELDTISGRAAKWEIELFDYLRPEEKHDLDRLEELYIAWHHKDSYIRYGKQDINEGPLLLRRDGRMKAFMYKGFWAEINEWEGQQYFVGWINGVSPRGLTEWFSINEAIGINNNGFTTHGEKAHYHENAKTAGIGVFGLKNRLKKHHKIQFWNYWFHNMYNTTWLQVDLEHGDLYGGIQYVHQLAMNRQSSLQEDERYMQPDEQSNVVSMTLGNKAKRFDVSAAYLHAFNTGRFLFPRELGREKFYVSQQRSWIDGFGNLDVYQLRAKFTPVFIHDTFFDMRMSYFDTPGADNIEFNKYGWEDFYALTFLIDHKFHGLFEGLDLALIYVGRFAHPKDEIALAEKSYRYDMHHFNLIANINF